MPSTASAVFLSWVRDGLSCGVGPTPAPDGTITIGVDIEPGDEAGHALPPLTATVRARLYGPGDIVGVDPDQIIRMEPAPDSGSAEPAMLASVEFDRPDLPWLFTPLAPVGNRLPPWLVLVVSEREPHPEATALLPVLTVTPDQPLPDLDESWAWAHAQVTVDDGDAAIAEQVDRALREHPERTLSRLVCPCRLRPDTRYTACLVPAYAAGRDAGLGLPSGPAHRTDPAWPALRTGDVRLPVYHHWSFRTGRGGSFEALTTALVQRPLPDGVGVRPMDVGHAGAGLPVFEPDDPDGIVGLEGALRARAPRADDWGAATAFADALRALLTAPDQALRPPLYGSIHAGLAPDAAPARWPQWLSQLNGDPRLRAAAAFGTRVVQRDQEALMAQAWHQAAFAEANAVIDRVVLAHATQLAIHRKRLDGIATWPRLAVLRLAQPLLRGYGHDPVRAPLASPVFRRLTRPLGPLGRRAADPLDAIAEPSGRAGPPPWWELDGAAPPVAPPVAPEGMATVAFTPPDTPATRPAPQAFWSVQYTTLAHLNAATPGRSPVGAVSVTSFRGGAYDGRATELNLPSYLQPSQRWGRPGVHGLLAAPVDLADLLPATMIDEDGREAATPTGTGLLVLTVSDTGRAVCWIVPDLRPDGTIAPPDQRSVLGPLEVDDAGTIPSRWSFTLVTRSELDPPQTTSVATPAFAIVLATIASSGPAVQVLVVTSVDLHAARMSVECHRRDLAGTLALPVSPERIRGVAVDLADLDGSGRLDIVLALLAWKPDELDRPYLYLGRDVGLDGTAGWLGRQDALDRHLPVWTGEELHGLYPFSGPTSTGRMGLSCRIADVGGGHRPDLVLAYPGRYSDAAGADRVIAATLALWDLDATAIPRDWSLVAWHVTGVRADYASGASCSVSLPDLDPERRTQRENMLDALRAAVEAAPAPNRRPTQARTRRRSDRKAVTGRASDAVLATLDPAALAKRALRRVHLAGLADRHGAATRTTLWRISLGDAQPPRLLAAPSFERPAYEMLRDLSVDLILPGVAGVPDESVTAAYANPAFVEAFLVGLNHEMSRELLWRGYRTDLTRTYFYRFWDGLDEQHPGHIAPIATWPPDRPLGGDEAAPGTGMLTLVVRGELVRRFPSAHVYAQPATALPGGLAVDPAAAVLHPAFFGSLPPDVMFFGFPLSAARATGADGVHPHGYFFVFEQQPTEARFGLDDSRPSDWSPPLTGPAHWSDLRWSHLNATAPKPAELHHVQLGDPVRAVLADRIGAADGAPLRLPVDTDPGSLNTQRVDWGADAAAMAHITFRPPVRVAVHATRLVRAETTADRSARHGEEER